MSEPTMLISLNRFSSAQKRGWLKWTRWKYKYKILKHRGNVRNCRLHVCRNQLYSHDSKYSLALVIVLTCLLSYRPFLKSTTIVFALHHVLFVRKSHITIHHLLLPWMGFYTKHIPKSVWDTRSLYSVNRQHRRQQVLGLVLKIGTKHKGHGPDVLDDLCDIVTKGIPSVHQDKVDYQTSRLKVANCFNIV